MAVAVAVALDLMARMAEAASEAAVKAREMPLGLCLTALLIPEAVEAVSLAEITPVFQETVDQVS